MTRGKRKQPAGYGEHGKPIVPTPCLHIWFAAKGVLPDFMEHATSRRTMNAPRWRVCNALALVQVISNDNEFQRVPGLMLENWV